MRRPGSVEDAELSRLVSCSAIAQKMGKVELWVCNGAGKSRSPLGCPLGVGSDPSNFRAYNAVLAFLDSTLRNSSRSPGNFKIIRELTEHTPLELCAQSLITSIKAMYCLNGNGVVGSTERGARERVR